MARFRLVALAIPLLLVAACGGDDPPDKPSPKEKAKAEILAFEVEPTTLPPGGGTVTISWKTRHATSAILEANGEAIGQAEPVEEGSLQREVQERTTFRLVAKGEGGDDTREVVVEVGEEEAPPRILSFAAEPTKIVRGETATLSWRTENAESVRILDGDGEAVDLGDANPAEGSVVVSPARTTTYTLVASRKSRSVEASTTVEIELPELKIVLFEPVEPGPRAPGERVEFRWEVQGADSLLLSNLEGDELEVRGEEVASGTGAVIMGESGRFRLEARREGESVQEELTIPLLEPPAIRDFFAAPPAVSEPGGTTTLHWSGVQRARSMWVESAPGGDRIELDPPSEEGSVEVEVRALTEFTLVVENAAGEARRTIVVEVVPLPQALTLWALPARVGVNEPFTLGWSTENGLRVTLDKAGVPHPQVSDHMLSATLADERIEEDTEYVLRVYNAAGDFDELRLTVTVGAPQIVALELQPAVVDVGGAATLSWQMRGGTSLRVFDSLGAEVCTVTDLQQIEMGSCTVTATNAGLNAFSVQVENGVGDVTEAPIHLRGGAGPVVASLTATPEVAETGEEVEIAWVVLDDALGATVTLSLSDGTNEYDLSGKDPLGDSTTVVLSETGTYEFTLTAQSANGSHQKTVEVRVVDRPQVTLNATPSVYDGVTPVTLSWTSENADGGLVLYEVSAGGQLIELYDVPETERASGSYEVEPTGNTTYRIVADNGYGMTAMAEVEVEVETGAPVILSFEADPEEVPLGEEVTLSWNVQFADEVSIDAPGITAMTVTELPSSPFVDISTTGTPLSLTQDCGWDPWMGTLWFPEDEGCATINFPQGFSFPFGGVEYDAVRVYANGVLGFDFVYDLVTYAPSPFPVDEPPVHIAPFWHDLEVDGVWYEFGSDARGQYLVVQWQAWSVPLLDYYFIFAAREFQVVLWEDGAFAFRYGQSSSSYPLGDDVMNGYAVVIGFQSPDGSQWENFHVGTDGPVDGGLNGRTWLFEPPPPIPLQGSFTFRPQESMTITLTATGPGGQTTATVDITVVPPVELQVSANPSTVTAGDPVTVSWTATVLSSGTPTVYGPLLEVSSPFVDISADPNAVELIGPGKDEVVVWHPFANGLQFPWGGELRSAVGVSENGYLTFDPNAEPEFWNEDFPNPFNPEIAIAPFWDDLVTRATGRVYALAQSDGSYVIQWAHVSRYDGSSNTNEYDLNFQVVLFPDGSFEFRYGTMAPPPQANDSNCTDSDCALDAQGASATIGFQNPTATLGYTFHHGNDTAQSVFPGGLANRSVRMEGGLSGSVVVYPEETTTYGICAELAGWLTCEEVEVEVSP